MTGSRAARLTAISQEAKEQSVVAIRSSLRLLRQPAYPADRALVAFVRTDAAADGHDGEDGARTTT